LLQVLQKNNSQKSSIIFNVQNIRRARLDNKGIVVRFLAVLRIVQIGSVVQPVPFSVDIEAFMGVGELIAAG
jgi:hypothetical protein